MFSKITHAFLLLLLITNLSACGNKTAEGDSNEKTISDSFLKLIASGGVSSVKDLEELEKFGVYGTIVGKAYYEGRVTLEELAAF